MRPVSSWGRLSDRPHQVVALTDASHVHEQTASHPLPGIAYGMGRSYGDVCLNPEGTLWLTKGLDHFVAFDVHSGRLTCEAGVLLRDIQQLAVPRGWMLPVTPGTQMITVGGAIANDVHGKNHHVHGTFGDHVHELTLVRTDGKSIQCGPDKEPEWFAATVGGLGLTGIITQAEIQLRRVPGPWLTTETTAYTGLDEFLRLADDAESQWEHTVSWVDCLSGDKPRGLFMCGNHTEALSDRVPLNRKLRIPASPPVSLVNRFTLRPFNSAYFHLKKRRAGRGVHHFESFFYPLDNMHDWNRMYGPRGFYQYQSVIPRDAGKDAVQAMLNAITRSGEGSFLAVLKTFGQRLPPGMLSFAQPGITLALDFPNKGTQTHKLFSRLDAIVREARGRIYMAKDTRMPRDLFESGYPRLGEFHQYRDPGISSELSRRLMGS